MTRYIRTAEQNKLIRAALKIAFPGFKFDSIRATPGGSIRVEWTNGPTKDEVDRIVQKFAGGYMDGMTDYKGGHVMMFKGEQVGFHGDFIFTSRTVTDEYVQEVKKMLTEFDGQTVCNMMNKTGCMMHGDDYNDEDLIARRIAQKMGQVFKSGNPELPTIIRSY